MRSLVFILILLFSGNLKADEYFFNVGNNHSAFPFSRFSKLAYKDFNMSFELGKRYHLRKSLKRTWSQTASIAYFRHKFVQSGIWLYGENEYHKYIRPHFSFHAGLGLGYNHMFTGTTITQQGADGLLEVKKDFGRPQAIFGASLGATRSLIKDVNSAPKIGLLYQIRMQTPFVKSYVPLLPYNALKISLIFPIHNKDA